MVHDLIPEHFYDVAIPWQKRVLQSRRNMLNNAENIVTVSASTAADLVRFFPEVGQRIHVVHHGPTLTGALPSPSFENLSSRYGLPWSPHEYYLYVGSRRAYKNFQLIKETLTTTGLPGRRGVIAVGGEKPVASETDSKITYLDFLEDSELACLYENAAALIYPSLYEGFGMPLLEAMSRECPVASSDAASLPEVGGAGAIYFDPTSSSELLSALQLIDKSDRTALVREGLKNAQRFDWEQSTARLLEVYELASQ